MEAWDTLLLHRTVGRQVREIIDPQIHLAHGGVVQLQVTAPAGEDVAALAQLGIVHGGAHVVERGENLLRVTDPAVLSGDDAHALVRDEAVEREQDSDDGRGKHEPATGDAKGVHATLHGLFTRTVSHAVS